MGSTDLRCSIAAKVTYAKVVSRAIPGNSGSKRETFFIMLIFYGVITEHKDKRIGGNE